MNIALEVLDVFADKLDSPENLEHLWLVTPFWRVTNVDQSFPMLGDSTLLISKYHPRSPLTYHLDVMLLLHRYFLDMGLEIPRCPKL